MPYPFSLFAWADATGASSSRLPVLLPPLLLVPRWRSKDDGEEGKEKGQRVLKTAGARARVCVCVCVCLFVCVLGLKGDAFFSCFLIMYSSTASRQLLIWK